MERTYVWEHVFVFYKNMNKTCVPVSCFFCVFSIYTGTPASSLFPTQRESCVIFSLKTKWHARWDMVLLPSLLRKYSSSSSCSVLCWCYCGCLTLFEAPHRIAQRSTGWLLFLPSLVFFCVLRAGNKVDGCALGKAGSVLLTRPRLLSMLRADYACHDGATVTRNIPALLRRGASRRVR